MASVFRYLILLVVATVSCSSSFAQGRTPAEVTAAFVSLKETIDSKSATVGQQITLRILADVTVKGQRIMPAGSTVLARIADVRASDRDQSQSALSIVVDKAMRADGVEVVLQAIIAAVAAPNNASLSSDPSYARLHTNEQKMTSRPVNGSGSGDLSSAAVATATLKGKMEGPLLLNENSAGAVGYEGLTLSWGLAVPPPFTVFVNKSRNIKLVAGTQMLLRMVPPEVRQ